MKNLILAITIIFFALENFSYASQNQENSQAKYQPLINQNGFADIVEDLLPTVVNISAQYHKKSQAENSKNDFLSNLPILEQFQRQFEERLDKDVSSIGSGFIISKDGYIVTNQHVILDSNDITISLNNGEKYQAKIIGSDKESDLALLKINPKQDLKFVEFGDSNKVRIGQWVIVIGNPYSLGSTVTTGILSARGRNISNGNEDFLQTDAAINKGNSGGPMFNLDGQVIGISRAIFSPSGGNVGIGFATPSNNATNIIKQLKEHGQVTRGWIGVSITDVNQELATSINMKEAKGAFVVEVDENGPAAKAGIVQTDIILTVDDQEISEMRLLPKIISAYEIGKKAKIKIWRQGEIKTLKVKIAKMENSLPQSSDIIISRKQQIKSSAKEILGLKLVELSAKITRNDVESSVEGLMIIDIEKNSNAMKKDLKIGDIIISANQKQVKSVKDLQKIIKKLPSQNKHIFLFVKRGQKSHPVILDLK